jgi:hypothetical protein
MKTLHVKFYDWTKEGILISDVAYILDKLSMGSKNKYDLSNWIHQTLGRLKNVTDKALELGLIEECDGIFSLADDIDIFYEKTGTDWTMGKTVLAEKNYT